MTEVCNIRAAFVAGEGRVLLSADYAQVEFRLLAHFTGDPVLLGCFSSGQDPFRNLAASWLGKPVGEVTPEQRNHAKRLAYGVLYGMGHRRLGDLLGIKDDDEARRARSSFLDSLPTLRDWLEGVRGGLNHKNTHVEMLSGRKRYFASLMQPERVSREMRGRIERAAANSIFQGSAADVVKGVMIRLHRELPGLPGPGACRMVLQIHDELLFEVEAGKAQVAARAVRRIMESAAATWGLRVALPVNLKVGPSWGELQPYDDVAGAVIESQAGQEGGGDGADSDDDLELQLASGEGADRPTAND